LLFALLNAAGGAAREPSCRLVAEWDAERDLVVYEVRRDDCATAAPAITGGGRRKSLFELYRISTGALVRAADCQISFHLEQGEAACDLTDLRDRVKEFGQVRLGHRGEPVAVVGDELPLLARQGGAPVDLAAFGELLVAATTTPTHRFFVLERDHAQILLRVPADGAGTARQQRELLAQAALLAHAERLGDGRPLVKAARGLARLSGAMLGAFCTNLDVAHRIDAWRAAARDLDGDERAALEAALAKRRCFGAVSLPAYDAARSRMAVAREWLDAVRRKDLAEVQRLSRLPLVIRGLWDWDEPSTLAACGVRIEKRNGLPESTLEIAATSQLDTAAPCLRKPKIMGDFEAMPALRAGRWPPDRGQWFAGTVGSTLPTTLATLPRDLRRYARALKPLLSEASAVQAVLTDNAGFTYSFVFALVPTATGAWRVSAVFADERFDE
jgi:hypothetical protein